MAENGNDFFTNVYNHAFPVLLRVVFRIVNSQEQAEEICHDAFLRFYQRAESFPDVDQATYWLLRVGKNLAFNASKRQGRERKAYERAVHEPKREQSTADADVLRKESIASVQKALMTLPRNLREVLILKEYGNLDYQEIAGVLRISVGNVKVRAHRARLKLAKALEEDGGR